MMDCRGVKRNDVIVDWDWMERMLGIHNMHDVRRYRFVDQDGADGADV